MAPRDAAMSKAVVNERDVDEDDDIAGGGQLVQATPAPLAPDLELRLIENHRSSIRCGACQGEKGRSPGSLYDSSLEPLEYGFFGQLLID